MKLNVAKKIKNYRLAKANGYFSIFEAISNSLDSYKTIKKSIKISIEFYRDNHGLDFGDDNLKVNNYQKVVITDNGVGLNDENYESFNTSDSDYKEIYGGKGLGRFSWLKVFEDVKVESIYSENNKYYLRKFDFRRTEDGITNHKKTEISKTETGTIISLLQQKNGWEIPKKISTFCEKIIESFLPLFINNNSFKITLIDKDTNEIIDAYSYFKAHYKGEMGSALFEIKGRAFSLSVHKTLFGNNNQFILYAQERASKTIDLSKHIIDLNAKLEDNLEEFHIIAFLTGQYLDRIVSPERDDFDFDDDEANISLFELIEKSIPEIKMIIKDLLNVIHENKKQTINQFVANEGPEYRYLLEKDPEIIKAINPNASKREIENHLHTVELRKREQTKQEITKILQSDKIDGSEIEQVYLKVSEEAKAELTKYILWRNHVLELLDKRNSLNDEKKYDNENEMHKLFYQMKVTSSDVPYECNNLWLIDERLNFHDYLASDLPIDGKQGDRPDIITYNVVHYFNNGDNPNNTFSVIEFKKPMRNDYTDDENPIDQVSNYIVEIRNGKAKKQNGQLIQVSQTTPCFAYVICTLTSKIRSLCEKRDFIRTYDNLGYFRFNVNLNTYFEVIDFEKIVIDAKNRNRIFMKKLGIK
ncbi:MAG: ATP-binding protein [Treponema sp.]|nr:ATP-binding protein [Treponema sp.]